MADARAPLSGNAGPPPSAETTVQVHEADVTGVRIGRYTLIRSIGRGGMGEVFLAHDAQLKRDVAIKVINPHVAGRHEDASAILREARAIARLNHPHIATVYDVLDIDGRAHVVMELLRGETLAQRLTRGPLPLSDVATFGCELTQALAHAHTHGIVHCDLKPANVFLTSEAGLKVVDFGLARTLHNQDPGHTSESVGASPSLIASRAGTPAYMSPEHRRGLPLDGRSDLYCTGLILHEMACGVLPHPSHLFDLPSDTTTTSQPPGLDGSIRQPLRGIIARALQSDPSARYQTASELEDALRPLSRSQPSATSRLVRRPRTWWLVGALVLTIVALLIALVARAPVPVLHATMPFVVAVVPFTAPAVDESSGLLASGLAEVVRNDLASYAELVITEAGPPEAPRSGDLSALTAELGANGLLLGNVRREPGRVAVTLRLYRADTGVMTPETMIVESDRDLALLQASLRTALRQLFAGIGLSLTKVSPNVVGGTGLLLPSTVSVFEEYQQARAFLERADLPQNVDHALTILNRIVAQEPRYALAHAALGDASWRKWRLTKDRTWVERAHDSAVEALRLAPEQPAVRFGVAQIYQGTGRRQEAIDELESLIRARPAWDEAYRLLGRLQAENGALDQSIATLDRAVALRPAYWANYAALGNVYYRVGRYDDAIRAFERFTELRPDSASAYQRLGTAQHASGRVDLAVLNYRRAVEIAPNANAYSNLGTALFDSRQYGAAAAAYQKAIDLNPRNPSLRRNIGDAFTRQRNQAKARQAYQQAIELTREVLKVNAKDASTMSLQAFCLARIGRVADALAASTTAVALAPADPDTLYERAVILIAAHQPAEAVESLRQALTAGYSRSRAQADDDLGSLRDQVAFRELLPDKK